VALTSFWIAALTTVFILGAVIVYVFVNGIGEISLEFIFTKPQRRERRGRIWPMIVATLYVTGLAMLIVTPIAVLAAVYLAEYAVQGRLVRTIRFAADTLASVPSIVMGLFGLAFFVEALKLEFSVLSGALALSFLMLPIVMRTTEEAIRAVPKYIRWGFVRFGRHEMADSEPYRAAFSAPRIITGIILATGRAVGETAVVIFTMGTMIYTPVLPTDPGRSMTVHLYQMAMEGINLPAAFGTALLLMVMILAFNLFARWLLRRNRRMQG